jgi:flagellar hook-associated protein 2
MPISSAGIGSGLDIAGLVSQLMSIEQRPLTLLAQKEASVQAKISAYGAIKGSLSSLQSAATAMSNEATFTARKAAIANADVATVAATTAAVAGSYSLEVNSLAEAQVVASGQFAGTTANVGSGTLTIQLGKYSAGIFTANPDKTAVNISIGSDAATLADVRDAINDANAGVTASLVNDGIGNRLVLRSLDGGTENTVKITAVDDDGIHTDDAGLSRLIYDASTGGTSRLTQQVPAADAALTVNGIPITSSTNTLTDAIEGVTLNLKKTNIGSPTIVTVTNDTSVAKSGVERLVKAYNDALGVIKTQTNYNTETDTAATLNGESTLLALRTRLSALVTTSIAPGLNLSAIGVSVEKDGKLAIDSTKLATALDNGNVQKLFRGVGDVTGLGKQMSSLLEGVIDSKGLITSRTSGLTSAAKALQKQSEVVSDRLITIEARYRKQFTALDSLISNMTATSNYLSQQLANLPTISSS